ncbi:uncharacterized protein N7511_002942 [Penicillium nucicola]|uniref:uncharacterized protein n=1 Tax=Penicillium nucicola TaxID=1850975 RepID=UPI0025453EFA|nr:uncharacterized protein N7511_002942 [Penicillium nucicola]KAJ5770891.1 hypothetical protein N7511_002942 [Penicillium nucicola]
METSFEARVSRLPKRQKILHDSDGLTLRHENYNIAWICALYIEMAAARAVLDEIHEPLPTGGDDNNTYVLGSIKGHNIVIACLPMDAYGIINAANVVTNLKRTFTAIRAGLMVGIGGGVPSKADIRLGDIIVGTRVMHTDLGKIIGDGKMQRTAISRIPHQLLGTAVSALRAKHELEPSKLSVILNEKLERHSYGHPDSPDRLFQATYSHDDPMVSCKECDQSKLVPRSTRASNDPVIHYGAIASGSQVIKDSVSRDLVARELNVICFEMEAAGLMDILPCLPIRGICDYSDSHKSKEWQKYAAGTAAAYARELLEELPATEETEEHVRGAQILTADQSLSQERRKLLLESLRFEQIDARKLTIKKAHAKTCRWLLGHPDYRAWLDPVKLPDHHGFLWITGKPGAGKSTIMKFAYSSMRTKKNADHKNTLIASFFFNARGGYLEKSVLGMYRSLIIQLLEGYPDLQYVLDDSELNPNHSQDSNISLNILKEVLHKGVQALGKRSFTCFVDALDECDEQQVLDMIQYFENLTEQSTAQEIPFRICFSSRHYPYILIRWGTRLTLEHQEGHTEDLGAYVRAELRAGDTEIIEKILEKAAGVFMWVVLVVDILNREYARGAMSPKRKLEQIPSDLSALFKDILKRDDENMEELLLCFLWILCAEHPLKPEEFYHAIWSGLSIQGLVDDSLPDASTKDANDSVSRPQRYVISCSKGLAEITKSKQPSVQFIHESVRDFLIKDRGLYELWPELGLDWESLSHEKLKDCCNNYLARTDAHAFVDQLPPNTKPLQRTEALDRYPFLEYACQNVLHHSNAAAKVVPQDNFISFFNLSNWITINNLFEKSKIREYTHKAPLLYVFADRGYPELIRIQVKHDTGMRALEERYPYPLFASLASGEKASTAALLGLSSTMYDGIDITEGLTHRQDLGQYKGRTPLSWAAQEGRMGMVKLLLQRGFAIDEADPRRMNPFTLAIRSRHKSVAELLITTYPDTRYSHRQRYLDVGLLEATREGLETVVRLLIERAADINTRDNDGNTPLAIASRAISEEVVRLLIDRGADINTCNNSGDTPLAHALDARREEVAILLIERGADINTRDNSRRTPLAIASRASSEKVVRLLIDRGAEINTHDKSGNTPLARASRASSEAVVKLLIDRGAEINSRDNDGDTPLTHALRTRSEEVATLLIDRGSEINSRDNDGDTPLAIASRASSEEVVRLLIDRGADINARDNSGRTPLAHALRASSEEVARLLIYEGADIKIRDNDGDTPLTHALRARSEEVAILLIDRGSEINSRDNDGDTPLAIASRASSEKVARLLIDRGADINARDDSGRTPLAHASRAISEEVARLLIDRGADINTRDNSGNTPLAYASMGSSEAVTRLLIERGADVNTRDNDRRTPLYWASVYSYGRNAELHNLLIKSGAVINASDSIEYDSSPQASTTNVEDAVIQNTSHPQWNPFFPEPMTNGDNS